MDVDRFYNWRIRTRFTCPGSDKYEKKKKKMDKRWVNPSPFLSTDDISVINDHICAKFQRPKMSDKHNVTLSPFVIMILFVVCFVVRVMKKKLFVKKGKSFFSICINLNENNVLCSQNQSKGKLDLMRLSQRCLYTGAAHNNWIKEDWSHLLSIGEFKRSRLNSDKRRKSNMSEYFYCSFYGCMLKIGCLICFMMNSIVTLNVCAHVLPKSHFCRLFVTLFKPMKVSVSPMYVQALSTSKRSIEEVYHPNALEVKRGKTREKDSKFWLYIM
jgi:hypothetical protein